MCAEQFHPILGEESKKKERGSGSCGAIGRVSAGARADFSLRTMWKRGRVDQELGPTKVLAHTKVRSRDQPSRGLSFPPHFKRKWMRTLRDPHIPPIHLSLYYYYHYIRTRKYGIINHSKSRSLSSEYAGHQAGQRRGPFLCAYN